MHDDIDYTARVDDVVNRRYVRATLMDGAVVYLHPDIALQFGRQLSEAAIACYATSHIDQPKQD